MTKEDKKALRDRLAKRTKAEMDALWSNPDFRREHAIWKQEYNAAVAMHEARQKAGLTQLDLAERMNTRRSNVSRMENGQNVTFATFARYLYGCGFDFSISVFPMKRTAQANAPRATGAPRRKRERAYA